MTQSWVSTTLATCQLPWTSIRHRKAPLRLAPQLVGAQPAPVQRAPDDVILDRAVPQSAE